MPRCALQGDRGVRQVKDIVLGVVFMLVIYAFVRMLVEDERG